ncbi:hypothetical protein L2E82_26577 [Cichorium intybus]|uniref:Uncharacterized protein n=1 Tax=Cichorium intybus TaxID=13427 RepID=A0ACB9CQN7_CICIN|nr:hypothetical protein L2E82_26577 [Cichorium intybus]
MLWDDVNELKDLRTEMEENARLKQEKSTIEVDPNMKSLTDVETALKQVDRVHMIVKRLEVENMEIRVEIVASKLITSASLNKPLCRLVKVILPYLQIQKYESGC